MSDLKKTFNPEAAVVPTVVEENAKGRYSYDIFSKLLKERIILLNGPIDDNMAMLINAQLLYLDNENDKKPIQLIISSPGGSVYAGLSIYDTMQKVKAPVQTVGFGICASMASFLLSAGQRGQRAVTPNTEVMIHQPRTQGGGGGTQTATDHHQNAKNINQMRRRMEACYSTFMGLPYNEEFQKKIKRAMEADTFLSAEMAQEMGLIDKVIQPPAHDTDPNKVLAAQNMAIARQLELKDAEDDELDPLHAAMALRDARNEYLKGGVKNAPKGPSVG